MRLRLLRSRSPRILRASVHLLGALCALSALPAAVHALHRETPPVVQVTGAASTVLGGQRYISNSSKVVFHSDADLLGNGNEVSQIFAFDLEDRVVDGLSGLTQLTEADAPSQAPSQVKRGDLAFESQADLLGNERAGWQIFLVRPARPNIGRGPIVQLTDAAGEARAPLINDMAKYVFFETTLDLLGLGLPAGSYLYRSEMGRVGGTIGNTACPSYPCVGNPGLELVAPVSATNPTGDEVHAGDVVLTLESMKMQSGVAVSGDGRVVRVHVSDGQTVDSGDVLVELER